MRKAFQKEPKKKENEVFCRADFEYEMRLAEFQKAVETERKNTALKSLPCARNGWISCSAIPSTETIRRSGFLCKKRIDRKACRSLNTADNLDTIANAVQKAGHTVTLNFLTLLT